MMNETPSTNMPLKIPKSGGSDSIIDSSSGGDDRKEKTHKRNKSKGKQKNRHHRELHQVEVVTCGDDNNNSNISKCNNNNEKKIIHHCQSQISNASTVKTYASTLTSTTVFEPVTIQILKLPKSYVNHSYRDYSQMPIPATYDPNNDNIRDMTFVQRVHHILSQKEYEPIIHWMPHGRAFYVSLPKKLENEILPKYFDHKRYSSFLRQLSNHNFRQISTGPDRGCQYHEFMIRGLPHLCNLFPKPRDARRLIPDPENEPNFYAITKMYPLPDDPDYNPDEKYLGNKKSVATDNKMESSPEFHVNKERSTRKRASLSDSEDAKSRKKSMSDSTGKDPLNNIPSTSVVGGMGGTGSNAMNNLFQLAEPRTANHELLTSLLADSTASSIDRFISSSLSTSSSFRTDKPVSLSQHPQQLPTVNQLTTQPPSSVHGAVIQCLQQQQQQQQQLAERNTTTNSLGISLPEQVQQPINLARLLHQQQQRQNLLLSSAPLFSTSSLPTLFDLQASLSRLTGGGGSPSEFNTNAYHNQNRLNLNRSMNQTLLQSAAFTNQQSVNQLLSFNRQQIGQQQEQIQQQQSSSYNHNLATLSASQQLQQQPRQQQERPQQFAMDTLALILKAQKQHQEK